MGFEVVEEKKEPLARIKVIGVGGGGGNALNNMILNGMEGVEFIVINTDAQDLQRSRAVQKFQLGTDGLGAGGNPDKGRESALEGRDALLELVKDCDMVFIAAGMGGGTGTGAAPIVAQIAKECGALTVAVVTRPFTFEGSRRRKQAEAGIENLRQCVDTLITIPNQRLMSITTEKTTVKEGFERADRVLLQAVKGVSDLINVSGLVNVDFADVRSIMQDKGIALMGVGQASQDDRVMAAAQMAINSPLLAEVSLSGARSVLVNITSSSDIGLHEMTEASQMIEEEAHEDVNLIWGWIVDEDMGNEVRVTVIATDFQEGWQPNNAMPKPASTPQPERPPRGGSGGFRPSGFGGTGGATPQTSPPRSGGTQPPRGTGKPASSGSRIPPFFGNK